MYSFDQLMPFLSLIPAGFVMQFAPELSHKPILRSVNNLPTYLLPAFICDKTIEMVFHNSC